MDGLRKPRLQDSQSRIALSQTQQSPPVVVFRPWLFFIGAPQLNEWITLSNLACELL
jgi:hypothetical protein